LDAGIKVTVLGSGTSHGVPMIACDCTVCTSSDPRDKRTRPSILIEYENPHRCDAGANVESRNTSLLVDTSPELRLQCLANNVRRVDAVLYTHHHIDHIAGLDDLRRFNWVLKRALTCYGQPETLDRLRVMFAYVFEHDPEYPSAKPQLELRAIDGAFEIGGRTITPIPLFHGKMSVLGFRVGNFAYCTDVSEIPAESWRLLSDLDVLILDALRKKSHPTHFNLEQAVDHARRIAATHTFFTHVAHELPHEQTNRELPAGMALAFDGQVISSS
jgi:phosphoribosyl 1,2-cyclic phosphate phosphodiesterase